MEKLGFMPQIQKAERIEYLDYAKAISIFMVMMCHRWLLKIPILGFAMPAFFIISGYTSKTRPDLRKYALKQVKSLLVPYWIACAVYCVIDVIRAYLFEYGTWRIVMPGLASLAYGSSYNVPVVGELGRFIRESFPQEELAAPWLMNIMTPLNCPLWFLPVMFSGSLIFAIVLRYRKESGLRDFLMIIVLILLGAIEIIPGMIQLPYGIGRGFLAAAYMLIGRIIKEKDIFNKGRFITKTCLSVTAAVIGIVLGAKGYMNGTWNISYYGNGGALGLAVSFVAGLLLVYAGIMFCRLIWLSPFNKLKSVLSVIGRNTMPTYLWHLALFFVADLIAVFVFGWQMTPEQYWVEIFDGSRLLYRWIVLFITWAVLVTVGEYKKNKRKEGTKLRTKY